MGIQTYELPMELYEEDTGVVWEYTAVVERDYMPPNPGTWDSDWDYYGYDDVGVVDIKDIFVTQNVLTFNPDTSKFNYEWKEHKLHESTLDEKLVEMLYKHAETNMLNKL